jgi:recombination protein RecR
MEFPSKLLEDAVLEIAKLPGIGKKTALRLALHLLRVDATATESLSGALLKMRSEISKCKKCNNLSDKDECQVCTSRNRNHQVICVVEGVTDLMAIENTGQYNGAYHVLGGVISPMDGIGPDDLSIDLLLERILTGEVQEVIFALNSSLEAETTTFYISKKLEGTDLKITSIARGVPVGSELEYTDEITLARSLASRTSYN